MRELFIVTLAWISHWFVHPKMELATVGEDYAVFFHRQKNHMVEPMRVEHLKPGKEYLIRGKRFHTLSHPAGKLLTTFATVNDTHIGESICGFNSKHPKRGPFYYNEPDRLSYAEMMSLNAVTEISQISPEAVLVKGDITDSGKPEEFKSFERIWGRFGDKLHWVCGNHDVHDCRPANAPLTVRVDLPGVTLALLDTSIEGKATGHISGEQLSWLEDICRNSDKRVMIFGHHHLWTPDLKRDAKFFGINPDDSEKLIELIRRYDCVAGYFSGHTHSSHVKHIAGLPDVPIAEVGAVKEFPGAWAEYRVYEDRIEQIMHRVASADSLRWEEMTSRMELDQYERHHFGKLADRCFTIANARTKRSKDHIDPRSIRQAENRHQDKSL